jgi:hypothetical protein
MWGLWGELPFPTTIVQFSRRRLHEICFALAAHKQELERNDYRRLVTARSRAETVLAAELAYGFGEPGLPGPYAESTTEVVRRPDGWRLGAARELDPDSPFPPPAGPGMNWWLEARSVADGFRAARHSGR